MAKNNEPEKKQTDEQGVAPDIKLGLQGATPAKAMRLLAEARDTIKHIQHKNDFINRWLKEADEVLGA